MPDQDTRRFLTVEAGRIYIPGRRCLSIVSLLVFTMKSARGYKKKTRVHSGTHKLWVAEGVANLL